MKLKIRPLPKNQVLPSLDFTELDGSDPLKTQEFYNKKLYELEQQLRCKSWMLVNLDNETPIGYFSVAMSSIELNFPTPIIDSPSAIYPAMQIVQMGVDKKLRKQGFGKRICQICIGMARDISHKRIGCRYVILLSNNSRLSFFKGFGFQKAGFLDRERTWLYIKTAK